MGTSIKIPEGYHCKYESPNDPCVSQYVNLSVTGVYKMQEVFVHEETKHPFLWMTRVNEISSELYNQHADNYIITPELLYMFELDKTSSFSDIYTMNCMLYGPDSKTTKWFFSTHDNLIQYTLESCLWRFIADNMVMPNYLRWVPFDRKICDEFRYHIRQWTNIKD